MRQAFRADRKQLLTLALASKRTSTYVVNIFGSSNESTDGPLGPFPEGWWLLALTLKAEFFFMDNLASEVSVCALEFKLALLYRCDIY